MPFEKVPASSTAEPTEEAEAELAAEHTTETEHDAAEHATETEHDAAETEHDAAETEHAASNSNKKPRTEDELVSYI